MKVLLAHNVYHRPGGEDEVFRAEARLLEAGGHQVCEYVRHNDEIVLHGLTSRTRLAAATLWARDSRDALRALLAREKPDIAHFHNTFPLMSPSVYDACADAGVPVVQSLHNARLVCPAATLYRNGAVCQKCLGHLPWRAVVHGCYHGSRMQTSLVAGMLAYHRLRGTWQHKVDRYIAFTESYRQMFVEAGLPADRIAVKPHFIDPDPGPRRGDGAYALYVGRLVQEKGVLTLMRAWDALPQVPLKVAGDGPLLDSVRASGGHGGNVEILGRLEKPRVFDLIKGARFLIWPSEGAETFGLVAAEAFACGVPVIASRLGAMHEMVSDGRTGLHFAAGDADELARHVTWAWAHRDAMAEMGRAARAEYLRRYTAERNLEMLTGIYQDVIDERGRAAQRLLGRGAA